MTSKRSLLSVQKSASSVGGLASSGGLKSDVSDTQCRQAEPLPKRQRSSGHNKRTSLAEDIEGVQDMLAMLPQVREQFDIVSKIGEGTFSSVYLATWKLDTDRKMYAIKHLVPTSSSTRVANEIYCLQKMGGKDHVISLEGYLRNKDQIALILPYFKHDHFMDYYSALTMVEVRAYMRALFEALRTIHSHGIIHRDIKPSNFLYNRAALRFQLVDFGLAHLELQTKEDRGSMPRIIQSHGQSSSSTKAIRLHDSSSYGLRGNRVPTPSLPKSYPKQIFQRSAFSKRQSSEKFVKSNYNSSSVMSCNPLTPRESVFASSSLAGHGRAGRGSGPGVREVCQTKHKETEVCELCMSRSNQVAPRAGTPGFRALEVLLKHPRQTTAVDIWSAGVILLCLLSQRYPFFRAHDDMSALAQIVGLFGSALCARAANSIGKNLICDPGIPPLDLRTLCENYRKPEINDSGGRNIDCGSDSQELVPESAYELMYRCLDLNPNTRISSGEALAHEFLCESHKR